MTGTIALLSSTIFLFATFQTCGAPAVGAGVMNGSALKMAAPAAVNTKASLHNLNKLLAMPSKQQTFGGGNGAASGSGTGLPSLHAQKQQRMEPVLKAANTNGNMLFAALHPPKNNNNGNDDESSIEKFHIPKKFMEGLEDGKLHLEGQNINLHYVAGGNPDSQELMVFVHGFPEFWYAWRHQLQHFRHTNLVYALDLRGFGLSDRPAGAINYTVEKHVKDLAEAIAQLKQMHPGKTVTLVTHDIGAAIGSVLQYAHPELVNRFVMMNAPNPKSVKYLQDFGAKQLLQELSEKYIQQVFLFFIPVIGELTVRNNNFAFLDDLFLNGKYQVQNKGAFTRADLDVYKRAYNQKGTEMQIASLTSALNFYRAPFAHAFETAAKKLDKKRMEFLQNLPFVKKNEKNVVEEEQTAPVTTPEKIQAKTLVIWGMADTVFGEQFADAAVKSCEDGRAVKLEGISHWVPEDAFQEVNANIEQFMAEPLA